MFSARMRAVPSTGLATAGAAALALAFSPAPAAAAGAQARAGAKFTSPLPVVTLRTQRAIPDDPKVRARVKVIAHGDGRNRPRRAANVYDGWGGVERRGQSSQMFPKKSYALELRTMAGKKRAAALLGMPADDDWVLYAAYNDKTLLRNVVAFEAAMPSRDAARFLPAIVRSSSA